MGTTVIQRAFGGGELAPALHARADQAKYVTGLRTCRNFMILRAGGIANRPGFRFVGASKVNTTAVFILRYVSEVAGESVLIEAGPNYLRFYKQGALVTLTGVSAYSGAAAYVIGDIVVSGGVNYYSKAVQTGVAPPSANWYAMPSNILEVPTPFGNAGFYWQQSGNVISMTSQLVAPHELTCFALTRWSIRQVTTAPSITAPFGVALGGGAAGTTTRRYIVTAGATDTFEESVGSTSASIASVTTPTVTVPITVTWTNPPNTAENYIYCDPYGNGQYGYLGAAVGLLQFNDVGQVPDFTITPPTTRVLFNTAGEYPAVSGYYQQRRFYGQTVNNPDACYGSRTGFYSNFSVSSPLQDDDAITFKMAGHQRNPIRHLLGLKTLIVLTDGGEWNVHGAGGVLTPSGILADQETYVGVNATKPVIIGNAIIYTQARGSIVRDLQFEQQVEGFGGRDLTVFASHLFDGYTIDSMDFQQTPNSIVWACRSDGTLLGLTYIREQEMWGWHRHDTGADGLFEFVTVVPEDGEDVVYVLVRRTIGGGYVRYIERLERREIFSYNADSFFVDSGLSYSGAPVSTISGLGHLEGEVLAVLADGVVLNDGNPTGPNATQFRVIGGSILNLGGSYSTIHAGLPIRFAEIETLDLDVQGESIRDKKKRIANISILVETSARTFWAGPDATGARQIRLEPWKGVGNAPFTGQVEMSLKTIYDDYGRVFIRQTDPLPLTILGLLPNVDLGG